MYRLFEQVVHIPSGYNGTMPNGDTLAPGATFSSIRSMYNENEKYNEYKNAYYNNGLDKLGTSEADMKKKQEVMETVELEYHRFWHAGDYLLALGTMAELYPDLQADKYEGEGDEEPALKVDSSITVEVGSTEKITSNVTGSTFKSADDSVASVGSDGTVTGVAAGTTTITVTTPNGQTATVKVTVTEEIPTGSIDIPVGDYLWGDANLDEVVCTSPDIVAVSKFVAAATTFPLGTAPDGTVNVEKAETQANVLYDVREDGSNIINSSDLGKFIEYFLEGDNHTVVLGPEA
jgi:hypothetical protein